MWVSPDINDPSYKLENGSKVAVIGGGPAGSMFSYFLINNLERLDISVQVDMYDPKDFTKQGPTGCNMCGGIISESLVQSLASEGIILPPTMVQRGIDSYVLHMDVGTVKIETPLQEKRIAAVHRGGGPRDVTELKWCSFDAYIQSLALEKGVNLISEKVKEWKLIDGYPAIINGAGFVNKYDLMVVAVGINSPLLKRSQDLAKTFQTPESVKTFIREFQVEENRLTNMLGSSMHVFLLDMKELEFAAAIPKGNYVTVCMLCNSDGLNTLDRFMATDELRNCLDDDLIEVSSCKCSPKMNMATKSEPFDDRVMFIGDSGVTRLYKDGIGAAYRTAKAAANAAAFGSLSKSGLKTKYWPTCQNIKNDNMYGKIIFKVSGLFKKFRITRKIMLNIVSKEQIGCSNERPLSTVLWDMFTGSAPYKDIFYRTLKPAFLISLFTSTFKVIFTRSVSTNR